MHPRIDGHTHNPTTLSLSLEVCIEYAGAQTQIYCDTHIYTKVSFCRGVPGVSVFTWWSMSDTVFLSPRPPCQEASESTESTLSRLPGPWNTDLYVSSKKQIHPFSLSTIVCLYVCECACVHDKSNEETRGLSLALNSVTLL